jgi:hypothetical protein
MRKKSQNLALQIRNKRIGLFAGGLYFVKSSIPALYGFFAMGRIFAGVIPDAPEGVIDHIKIIGVSYFRNERTFGIEGINSGCMGADLSARHFVAATKQIGFAIAPIYPGIGIYGNFVEPGHAESKKSNERRKDVFDGLKNRRLNTMPGDDYTNRRFEFVKYGSVKRDKFVPDKVPEHGHQYGQYFGKIKIEFLFFMKQPQGCVVDGQPAQRNQNEHEVLGGHVGVAVFKRPETVPDVIVGCGQHKTQAVGGIFVHLHFFFEQPGNPKVYEYSGGPHQAKFEQYVQRFFHKTGGQR